MKKISVAALWMVAIGLVLASGCNKEEGITGDDNTPPNPAGVTNEQLARQYYVETDAFVSTEVQSIDDEEVQPTDYGTFGQIENNVTPIRWGRFVTSVARTITDTVQTGDSIAVVHIHNVITGTLKIKAINGNGDTVLIQKPFTDQSDRNVMFRRFARNPRRFMLNWLPVAISLVDGNTISPNNINLTKLEIMTANDTITITDPLAFYLRLPWRKFASHGRHDLPDFVGGGRVVVRATVQSTSPDTDIVALRYGRDPLHKRRVRMQCVSRVQVGNLYEGVYENQITMHVFPGSFHVAVDALTRETLFDDQAPYSVSWWGVPYRVM